jgi:hypothetical protein
MSTGAGKGDAPRPTQVPPDEYARRWEQTFGKPPPLPQEVTP